MDNVLWFLIGVVIGWLVRWIYMARATPKSPSTAQSDVNLSAKLITAEEKIKQLSSQLEQARQSQPRVLVKEKDRLERIHGIGPVFARRLNKAGVFTYGELAALSPERVNEIISPEDWQAIAPGQWISEASELAFEDKPEE